MKTKDQNGNDSDRIIHRGITIDRETGITELSQGFKYAAQIGNIIFHRKTLRALKIAITRHLNKVRSAK